MGLHGECKKSYVQAKSLPFFLSSTKKYPFLTNSNFWLNLLQKFILENIFWGENRKFPPKKLKMKILYLKPLVHSRQPKPSFFYGFSQKNSTVPIHRQARFSPAYPDCFTAYGNPELGFGHTFFPGSSQIRFFSAPGTQAQLCKCMYFIQIN